MTNLRLIEWMICHCDLETFGGMGWHNKDEGILWLYWLHQSSSRCKKNKRESAHNYEYYTAWAIHKNNLGNKRPRELKAAFRNALEKKAELRRVVALDTKERVYWKITNISEFRNGMALPVSVKKQLKSTSARSKKSSKSSLDSVQSNCEFPSTSTASTSNAFEDSTPVRKRAPKSISKGPNQNRKIPAKTKKPPAKNRSKRSSQISMHEPGENASSVEYGDLRTKTSLPSFSDLLAGSKSAYPSLNESFRNISPCFTPPSQSCSNAFCMEKLDENVWTPQIFSDRYSPAGQSSDIVPISTEVMDCSSPSQTMPYSFQPTPPQQITDVLLENNNQPERMNTLVAHDVKSTMLKYWPPCLLEAPNNQSYQNNRSANPPIATNYSRPEIAPSNCTFTSLFDSQLSSPISGNAFAFESEQRTNQPFFENFSLDQRLYSEETSLETLGSSGMQYALTPSPQMFPDEPETFSKDRAAQNDGITDYQCSETFNNSTQMYDDSLTSDINLYVYANRLLDNLSEKYNGQSDHFC